VERIDCVICGGREVHPVCLAGDRLAPDAASSFTVVRCNDCGLAFLDPRPSPGEIGAYYPDDYHTPRAANGVVQRAEHAWRRRQLGEVANWLARLRPGRGQLLDVGCGSGELLEALRADGWRVSGVEPSTRSAAIAREQRGLDVTTTPFDQAELPERAFDVIVFAAVLEHLHEPVAALARARRLLAPGGLVAVLFLPRFDAPQARLFGARWLGLDLPRHLYHFEPGTFEDAAARAGLTIAGVEPYSRRHSPAFWTASLFPGLQKQRLNLLARTSTRRAAAGKAAFAALTAAARPLARLEAALGFEPQRSYFLVADLDAAADPDHPTRESSTV